MKKWFFGDKKKKATNNTAENSNTVNSSSERAPIPAHDPRHPIVQSKGLKIEDITCSIKSNDDDHHKKDSRKGEELQSSSNVTSNDGMEESFTKSDGLNTSIDSVDLASNSIDQEKARLEHSERFQRCKTIEDKLEWIDAELKQRSPDVDGVMTMLEGIISRLAEQESYLDGGDKFNSKAVKDFLNNFPTMTDGKRRSTINTWLRKVRPINITQLLQLINETEAAAMALEDQDVVMFL
eukprot:gene31209-41583_t